MLYFRHMKRKIIVGNWKMHPVSLDEAKRIFGAIKRTAGRLSSTHVVVCPSFVYIDVLRSKRGPSVVGIGAQNVFFEQEGSYTGEISPIMLKDFGVTHVIVGHSERRAMGETDEIVAKKVQAILEAGIHPILCVGESVRDTHALYLETLRNQIKNSLTKTSKKLINHLIIAYEPVWAIEAKEPMDTATIQEMALFVKKVVSDIYGHDNGIATPILYGGAVNFRNAGDIISRGGVDGLLVGRESVNAPGFTELLKAVDNL